MENRKIGSLKIFANVTNEGNAAMEHLVMVIQSKNRSVDTMPVDEDVLWPKIKLISIDKTFFFPFITYEMLFRSMQTN